MNSFLGAADYANNLISPNPTTVSFKKGDLDGVKPTVSSITSKGLNKVEIKFSEEVQGFDATDVTIDGVARTANDSTPALATTEAVVAQDSTDKTKYVVEFVPFSAAGLHTVGLVANGLTDYSGETNAVYSKLLEFKADTVNPTLVSSEVKIDSGVETLYLTFSEAVDAGTLTALTATQVKDYVTVNGTINLSGLTAVSGSGDKQYKFALSGVSFTPTSGSAAVVSKGASYTVSLTGAFDDKSNNLLGSTSITFVRGADTDTAKPTVVTTVDSGESTPQVASNGIYVIDQNTFQITFDRALDGASATNKANYMVNGVNVNSATLLPGNIVEVKFEADSNTLDGLRNVTVSGVKSSSGVQMDTYTTSEYFVENVKPTIASATLFAGNQIKVVFTEAVTVSKVSIADLDVYVGTTQETETTATVATAATIPGTHEKEFINTLDNALTPAEFAQTLTVELVADSTATSIIDDAKGNLVHTGVFSVTK